MKLASLALLAGLAVPLAGPHAQPAGGDSYVIETRAQPGCRPVVFHVTREGGRLAGVVFFKDGSGISSVEGHTDGTAVSWTMSPVSGNGPTGRVDGTLSPQGVLAAKLVGGNCTLDTMIPRYATTGSGG